jgi:C4-dicarboxylate-specific signal transduction histidine kinase
MFDWRELRRWGIDERRLPDGSIVMYRELSVWELYKRQIIGVLAFCAILVLLIAVLLVERRKRLRAFIELDERVRFETLLSKLSADFTNLPTSKVDALVKQWLERLKDFLGDSTILFFEVTGTDGEGFNGSSVDLSSRPRALPVGTLKEDEWCLSRLRRGLTINPANTPAAFSSEKNGEKPTADLKSLLAIPVSVNGATFALALETTKPHRVWPKDLEPRLRMVGEIFAGALERKRAGEELQKTRNDLAHVARLTAMGEMAASIAHEVNQPLAAIATYGDACVLLLSGESPNVKKSLEAINQIIKDSIRASEVVKRIRALVKKTSHEMSLQDLNQIILEMVAVTDADVLTRSIQLELNLARDLPWVMVDCVELQQVMLNLILNGIEAMSDITDRARELTITSSMNGGGQVVVTVQDTGVGLSAEQAQRIFDPFVTTKPNGLGMGLSITRTILQAHGGRLWAEPNEGPGAMFKFTLPAAGAK